MQFAMTQKAIIAKRTGMVFFYITKPLIYKDLFPFYHWHADCITNTSEHISSQTVGHRYWKMNKTLSVLNAAALVALVAFHFQDSGAQSAQVSVQDPVQHHISQAPKLAVMTDRSASAAILANDDESDMQAPRAEQRWVF